MSQRSARLRAYAKINLSLKVLGKRSDGFHELRTVFQTIALHDSIEIAFTPGRKTSIDFDDPLKLPENLVLRAARLFFDEKKVTGALQMKLVKRIPMGGGLGGGSTDAAAVLLALPALTGKRTTLPELMRMGAALGSDVPFFMVGGAALGIGRGEELFPLPEPKSLPLLVLAPPVHVSTPEAYRALQRPALTSPDQLPKLDIFQSFVWQSFRAADAENDFEDAVFQLHPELGRWQRKLERLGAHPARLSGSGAALFGVFPDQANLQGALSRFRSESLQVFSTRTLTRAQYHARWWKSLREHTRASARSVATMGRQAGKVERNQELTLWPPQSRYAR